MTKTKETAETPMSLEDIKAEKAVLAARLFEIGMPLIAEVHAALEKHGAEIIQALDNALGIVEDQAVRTYLEQIRSVLTVFPGLLSEAVNARTAKLAGGEVPPNALLPGMVPPMPMPAQ